MATVGYKRVSTEDQNTDRQDLGLLDKLFEEKISAATAKRPALTAMIEYVREGDLVKVHSIDRLARNLIDLQGIITQLRGKGVSVTFAKENLTFRPDVDDAASTFYLQILGAVAQFERAIIRERQREGIAKAKANGVYTGRKPSIDKGKVKELHGEGLSTYKISEKLGISRMSVHRILNPNSSSN